MLILNWAMASACLNDSKLNFDSGLALNVNSCLESILRYEEYNYLLTISVERSSPWCYPVHSQRIMGRLKGVGDEQWHQTAITSFARSPVFDAKRRQWWQWMYECHLMNFVASKLRPCIRLYSQRNILAINNISNLNDQPTVRFELRKLAGLGPSVWEPNILCLFSLTILPFSIRDLEFVHQEEGREDMDWLLNTSFSEGLFAPFLWTEVLRPSQLLRVLHIYEGPENYSSIRNIHYRHHRKIPPPNVYLGHECG